MDCASRAQASGGQFLTFFLCVMLIMLGQKAYKELTRKKRKRKKKAYKELADVRAFGLAGFPIERHVRSGGTNVPNVSFGLGSSQTERQELAATVQEPPSRYLLREHEGLGGHLAGAELPELIPTIDLGLLSASNDAEEATKLRSALRSWGFFKVSNHGMETSLMDSVMIASREFFHLPLEEKKKCSNLIDGKHFQVEGYGNDQVTTQDQILDWSDRLHLRIEPEGGRNLAHWPTHPKSFRDDLHEYALNCKRIKSGILKAMAKLLDLDEDCLVNQFNSNACTNARFNYFPPCPRPDLVLGGKPHSDFSVLTVLLMDKDVAGLQYLRDGTWYNVPPVCNHTLLINIGCAMEIMTNGIFTGPVHRVVTNADKERISVAMFYSVDPEQEIGPIAHLLSDEQPARYRKMKAKDYLVSQLEHYSQGRGARIADAFKI